MKRYLTLITLVLLAGIASAAETPTAPNGIAFIKGIRLYQSAGVP